MRPLTPLKGIAMFNKTMTTIAILGWMHLAYSLVIKIANTVAAHDNSALIK